MYKVYLIPSNQINNSYAYGNTTEAIQCRRIANECEAELKRCGFEVKNNQTSSMSGKVAEGNKWGADLYVCIHTNAYNGKVAGTRAFCKSSFSCDSSLSILLIFFSSPLVFDLYSSS